MIFAVDVGNTHIVIGLIHEGDIRNNWRICSDRRKTEDEYGHIFQFLLDLSLIHI